MPIYRPVRHLVPVIFEDRSSPPRPRTGTMLSNAKLLKLKVIIVVETLESGIDVNQPDVEKKRKKLLSTGKIYSNSIGFS